MRNLGRCGRSRRKKCNSSANVSQEGLPQYVNLQIWLKTCPHYSAKTMNSNLRPCDFNDTGRGLQAMKTIQPGDTIVSIPMQFLVTSSTVLTSEIGFCIKRYGQIFTPQQLLTIFLVIESCRGSESPWAPYIDTLPALYSTPLYFSPLEISLLKPKVQERAKELRERFCLASQAICKFVEQHAPKLTSFFTADQLRWAWSTVDTRSVYLQTEPDPFVRLDPEESNVALAPFLDLLNHTDTATMTAQVNTETNSYEIVTENRYHKWDQVFICYGAHDNAKLLVNYGFVLPHNCNNVFSFTIDDLRSCSPNANQYWSRKLAILKEANLLKNLVCTTEGVSWSLATALKIIVLPWNLLPKWNLLMQGLSLSPDVEAESHAAASSLVLDALRKAKTHLNFVKSHKDLVHKDLLLQLALDDVNILETTLASLIETP